jgi:hypothetical protein
MITSEGSFCDFRVFDVENGFKLKKAVKFRINKIKSMQIHQDSWITLSILMIR